jgi:anaerobic magnesium-protoporphyrin IX monomethyl ester cyclase
MRVAMIFPGIAGTGFKSYGDEVDSSWHSHGLCGISSCLKNAGHEVFLIDLRTLTGWDEYQQKIAAIRPGAACITMMSCDFDAGLACAELAHRVDPSIKTIVGGPHPSIVPEDVAACRDFDYILQGEGEISVPELISAIEEGRPTVRMIRGTPPDLDTLPYPDRELFGPHEIPIPLPGFAPPFMTFIAGRGCRYNCSFCQPAERKIFGPKVRRRSPENFVGELIECQDRYGYESYLIHDDCLLEDILWVEEFCRLLKSHGIRVPFACQGRADLICRHPQTLRMMKKVGLSAVLVGFESGNDRILKFLRKGVRVEQNIEAAKILRDLGIHIWANYMLGIPTETADEMLDTVKMIRQIRPDHFSPAIYTPFPGSDLFEYCVENGLILPLSHGSFRRNVTEVKIKGQDLRLIEWAVSESMGTKPEITPYSKDYVPIWGELVDLANTEEWHSTVSSSPEKFPFSSPSVQNLSRVDERAWRSTTLDPQFIWEFTPSLQPSDWRYLVVDLEVDSPSKAQFIWWTGEAKKFQASRHFRVSYGRRTYVFDLDALKTFGTLLGDGIRWTDFPVRRFRFDPCERKDVTIVLHEIFLVKRGR